MEVSVRWMRELKKMWLSMQMISISSECEIELNKVMILFNKVCEMRKIRVNAGKNKVIAFHPNKRVLFNKWCSPFWMKEACMWQMWMIKRVLKKVVPSNLKILLNKRNFSVKCAKILHESMSIPLFPAQWGWEEWIKQDMKGFRKCVLWWRVWTVW